ncbi:glycosyltransferase family 4 protein [Flavivirga eckloniae]|uniref:Glycosyltransferase family 1 protein n=1 Tax=Flavivirga eckloniae TaxID=1803846 RepID=A0A2K9PJQ4_9FLAO|nr:glycosyltransferase family 4 protein [Flavivirga eckloniae]AUP77262.1 glycosyltransferase family 1 protein [Flavivirga eckloniae]
MKKNICFIVSSPYSFYFLKNHFEKLTEDYNIYLVANIDDKTRDVMDNFEYNSYKSISINRNINVIKDIKAIYDLYKYFKQNKFHSIHSLTPKAGLTTAIAGKLAGIKTRIHIFTGQVWATKTGTFRSILKVLDKIIVSFSTHILVDGNSQRNFLISEKVLKANQGQVLGTGSISGVDIEKFSPNADVREQVRKKLNISKDTVVYLFLGRLTEDKGIIELAKAYQKLRSENENVYLLLVGNDEGAFDEIDEIINNREHFDFVGTTDTPEIFYQASDVFCLPSYREGFGMSVIEASSCGIPVICSDAYGLMDTIVDNKTGLRHKVKDVDDLYDKMSILSKDSDLRHTLGKSGITYIKDNFSSKTISNEWVRFYKELV